MTKLAKFYIKQVKDGKTKKEKEHVYFEHRAHRATDSRGFKGFIVIMLTDLSLCACVIPHMNDMLVY